MKEKRKTTAANTIRGNLTKKGWTLTGWAKKHGYSINTVQKALRGERTGPLSKEIISKLRKVAR